MPVRGLTIVVAGHDSARFRCALGMAAAQAALGGKAHLFLDGAAAALAVPPIAAADDAALAEAGLPTLAELVETCLDLGVRMTLCQSGLGLAGHSADLLDPRVGTGGMAGLLAALGEDRLVTV